MPIAEQATAAQLAAAEDRVEQLRAAIQSRDIAEPDDAAFRRAEARQQAQMGTTIGKVIGSVGEGVERMHKKRRQMDTMLERIGVQPWSVINCNPYPLNINGVVHRSLVGEDGNQVPPCPVGSPFVQKVIYNVEYSNLDQGAGLDDVDNITPEPCEPGLLAQEYFAKYGQYGGVIIYAGDEPPDTPGLRKVLGDARQVRNKNLIRKVREAESMWAEGDGARKKEVTEVHRGAAAMLLYEKILKKEPVWLIADINSDLLPDPCPGCGAIPEPGAAICKNMDYVFRPVDAYMNSIIKYEDTSLDRLTVEEWHVVNAEKARRDANRAAGLILPPPGKSGRKGKEAETAS